MPDILLHAAPGAHGRLGVAGLCTCAASTAPVGGIAGSSGKHAALQLLKQEA